MWQPGRERGVWGENRYMNIMAESLCCSPETICQYCMLIGLAPMQNLKKKKTRKKLRMLISTGSIFRQSSKNMIIYLD